nr:MOSC domain-containing protein [Gymnodinialimonas phycosphaerae]
MGIGALHQIWRYPVKGIGAERLRAIDLAPGMPLPLDRAWAVLEEGGDASEGWRSCRNFLRGAKGPSLMAVTCRVDGDVIHFSHPDRPDISVLPGHDDTALFDWLAPIYPEARPKAVALVKSPPEGMSDAPFASISILNASSLRALGQKLGQPLDERRFRGNLWIDGFAPWEEFDLVGKTLEIGGAHLEIIERITRCRATEANPETGKRDANTLRALEDGWGHQDFGVYAMVRTGGTIKAGDVVTVP